MNIYLIFHFNRVAFIGASESSPDIFLMAFLTSKNMAHLYKEFSVWTWSKGKDSSRGDIELLYDPKEVYDEC